MSLELYIKEKKSGSSSSESSQNVTVNSRIRSDKKLEIVKRVKHQITELRDELSDVDGDELEKQIKSTAFSIIDGLVEREYGTYMFSQPEKYEMLEKLSQDMFGFGVIEPFLDDETVTEIMINGPSRVFIEKSGKVKRAKNSRGAYVKFESERELRYIIDKIVAPINRKVDESDPIVDARLPDGSRVNIVLNSVSLSGTTVTIRKFPENPYSLEQLVAFGSLPDSVASLLKRMVKSRYNIIVSGGTGSGKTTFLNALSQQIPVDSRVITVEDSAELKFNQVENLVRLETRPPNIEGNGAIPMRQLVKSALRMRPDRIVVGEVRSGEALDMLQAMNTGHDGSLSTGHANSAEDMLLRLETMVLMAGMELPIKAIRQQVATAVDFIVHLSKLRDGSRRVVEIVEILGLEGDEIRVHKIYDFIEEDIDLETEFETDEFIGQLCRTEHNIVKTKKFYSAKEKDFILDLKAGEVK